MISTDEAIEIFVNAYCLAKSRTHPYVSSRHGDLWVMRDGPGKKRDPRKIEVVTHGIAPAEVVRQVQDLALGWHFVSYLHENQEDLTKIRSQFRAIGYRAIATEWLFVHDLNDILPATSEPPAKLIDSPELLATIKQRASHPAKLRAGIRLYGVWDEEGDKGWVQSVPFGKSAWTANLYVHEQFRRHGYASSLMCLLLQDDKRLGFEANVLLASTAGAKLYPKLGFKELGTLQIFCPMDRGR